MDLRPFLLFRPPVCPPDWKIPLRLVLVVPIVLQSLAAVGLTSVICQHNGQQALVELANDLLAEKGDRIQLYLENQLKVPHLINRLNADAIRQGQLPGFVPQNPRSLEKHFWLQLKNFPQISTIAIANRQGGMIGSGRLPDGQLITYSTTNFLPGRLTGFQIDAQGNPIRSREVASSYNASVRPWFTKPARQGQAVWSDIYQFTNSPTVWGISAGLPYYDEQRQFQGVLAVDITLESLSSYLKQATGNRQEGIFIMEPSGFLVAASSNERLFLQQGQFTQRRRASESQNDWISKVADNLEPRLAELGRLSGAESFIFGENDGQQFVRVIPLKDAYGLNWLIVVAMPRAAFMTEIDQFDRSTRWLTLAALAGSLCLGLLIARWLARPIQQLSQASRNLMLGQWPETPPEQNRITELEVLAHSFNEMTRHLQQSFTQVKTALQESEEKFSKIFRTSPDAIAINSLETGRYLEVNDSFVALTGYSRQEVLGQTAASLNLLADLDQARRAHDLLQHQSSFHNHEQAIRTRSGEVRTVLISAEVIELEGKSCLLSVTRDITERKQIEEALRLSESKFAAAFQASPDPMVISTLSDGRIIEVNSSLCRVSGYRREALIGQSSFKLNTWVNPEERNRIIQLMKRQGRVCNQEVELRNRTGERRHILFSAEILPINGEDCMLAVIKDITERKHLELALQASQAKLSDILESCVAAISYLRLWADGREVFDYLSQNHEVLLGYTAEEFMADPTLWKARIYPEDLQQSVYGIPFHAIQDGSVVTEYRFCRRDGQLIWLQDHLKFRWDAVADCWLVTGVAIDITIRKQAEAALQKQERQLRQMTDALPVYISYLDRNLQYRFVNRLYERRFGCSREELYGKYIWEVLGETAYQDIQPHLEKALAGQSVTYEVSQVGQDGWLRHFISTLVPDIAVNGTVQGCYCLVTDISDRKQAELFQSKRQN